MGGAEHSLLGHSNVAQEKGFSVINASLNKPPDVIHDSPEKSRSLFSENHSSVER